MPAAPIVALVVDHLPIDFLAVFETLVNPVNRLLVERVTARKPFGRLTRAFERRRIAC